MKKFTLLVAVLAMIGMTMTSCDKDKERCWKVDTDITIGQTKTSSTTYIWATQNEIDPMIEEIRAAQEKVPGAEVKIRKSISTKRTAEDCAAGNVDDGGAKCWKFVYKAEIAGAKAEITTYEWLTKETAIEQEKLLEEKLGVDVKRTLAVGHNSAKDCANANTNK